MGVGGGVGLGIGVGAGVGVGLGVGVGGGGGVGVGVTVGVGVEVGIGVGGNKMLLNPPSATTVKTAKTAAATISFLYSLVFLTTHMDISNPFNSKDLNSVQMF